MTSPSKLQNAWMARGGRHAFPDEVQNENPKPIHEARTKPWIKKTACSSTKPPLILLGTTSFMRSCLRVSYRTLTFNDIDKSLCAYWNGAQKHESASTSDEAEEDEFANVDAPTHEGRRDNIEH